MNDRDRALFQDFGLLLLRLGVGVYMMTHGWGKLQMVLDGRFDQFGDPIGLGSAASLILITFAEFFCALFVAAGFATRLSAIPVVIGMLVAAFLVHGADPWTMGAAAKQYMAGESQSWSSKEPALIYGIPYLALVFTGPGKFSIDAFIAGWWRQRSGANASLAEGE